jgi:DNA-binding IclR family transcriptional regulator
MPTVEGIREAIIEALTRYPKGLSLSHLAFRAKYTETQCSSALAALIKERKVGVHEGTYTLQEGGKQENE